MEPIQIKAPTAGVRPDLDPEDVADAAMVASENMIVRDGSFQVRPGFKTVANDINERPMAYAQYDYYNNDLKTVLGTDKAWWKLNGSTWTSLAGGVPLTGTEDDAIVFRTFSKAGATWLLGTNGTDVPKKWDGATAAYASVGGSPPRARCMCVVADRVVLGNLLSGATVSPLAIDVSANKDFDSGWGTQLVALLADTEGGIVSMEEMGTLNAAILKSDSVYMLIAQASIDPFRVQWVKSGIPGPASAKMSAKMADGSVAFTGKNGMVSVFDGSNVQQLPYSIQKQITKTANLEQINRGFMMYDPDRRELWIIYPLVGSDNSNGGILINMSTMGVYPLRFNGFFVSAAGKIATTSGLTIGDLTGPIGGLMGTIGSLASTTVLRRLVVGEIGGQTLEENGTSDNGSAIPFYWETPVRGTAERYMTIDRIRHRFRPAQNDQNVSLALGKRNQGAETPDYGTPKTINLKSTLRRVTGHRTTAEYFSLKFSGNGTEPIVYQGSALYGHKRGQR